MPSFFREEWIPLNDLRLLRVHTQTSGKPIAFLHGVTRNWQTFKPLFSALSLEHQIHAIDFRGHGKSDRSVDGYRAVDYVPDALELLRKTDGPTVLYGHSLGAMVAAAAAAESPELVRGLILEDPPFDTMGSRIGETPLQLYFQRLRELAGAKISLKDLAAELALLPWIDPKTQQGSVLGEVRDPVSIRFTAQCLKALDPEVLSPVIAADWLAGYHRDRIFQNIRCPVLVLQADLSAGGMLTDSDAAQLQTSIEDCTLVPLKGAPHLLHWARTQEVLNLCHAFIASLETARSPAPRTGVRKELQV
ncbi:alpha/beta fold hydrolase [Planctomicrobium sp. SH661]|uniref:alpha/beta fold hydrolase n=1 Tax=Planctomicrobium sp. SH661 TaxID=3448124 RepID=UPI003F5BE30C